MDQTEDGVQYLACKYMMETMEQGIASTVRIGRIERLKSLIDCYAQWQSDTIGFASK
jgi:hypothetical protein